MNLCIQESGMTVMRGSDDSHDDVKKKKTKGIHFGEMDAKRVSEMIDERKDAMESIGVRNVQITFWPNLMDNE